MNGNELSRSHKRIKYECVVSLRFFFRNFFIQHALNIGHRMAYVELKQKKKEQKKIQQRK